MILLLIIIYISFISLGLPDSLLGSAWPSMYENLSVPISYAGVISMITSACMVVSSVFSEKAIRRLGTHIVSTVSVLLTAAALLGFSLSGNLAALCICAVPLGLGAGTIDAALNNYVAAHFKAKHMSWLHCFWGIGATAGPVIMSFALLRFSSWRLGYRIICVIQFILVAVLFFSRTLWEKPSNEDKTDEAFRRTLKLSALLRLKGAKQALASFFCYCSIEWTVGLWGSSFMVVIKNITPETAAKLISLYFFGITIGRLISGFLTMRLSNRQMVRLGMSVAACGILLTFLPYGAPVQMIAFLLIGMGLAPIFPSLLHDTPVNFGSEYSQSLMGLQMACAGIGSTLMPPFFGMIASFAGYGVFPIYLCLLLSIMLALDLSWKR